jgi:DNA polymerase III sliding clamp (beta) subunit (PCNA family)
MAKNTNAGGVVVGKRRGQTMIFDDATAGGYFVGKLHSEGGIKAINKSTGQPIEVQSAEVIITAPAVADQTKREFDGKMMTNREILSTINERGGGVGFAKDGMEIPTEMHFSGQSYNYGGKMLSDHDIAYELSQCGCEHEMKNGGGVKTTKVVTYKDKYNRKYNYPKNTSHTLEEISKDTNVSIEGLQQIYNKGIGAYKTNPSSVRPNVKSKEQWAMARVYSAVMGGKASKVDSNELKMNLGGDLHKDDLEKDSKSGNTPARDLNNYNDLMDVGVDSEVGGVNGLAFEDGGFMSEVYDKGGQTLSAEVFEWDKVPSNYRNISKVKKVPFSNNPLDKGLDSILSPFLGKDNLRPNMMGVNFDENGITATNAFVLITLPYPNEKYNGIYDINKVKKEKSSEALLINENYPNYKNIIPNYKSAGTPYLISVYKLLQYTKTAMNYANKVTHAIGYKFGDNEVIGFNGQLLSEVLTSALKLGHEKIYIFVKSDTRAIILSPNKEYELGSDEILIIMPVMVISHEGYGAEDVDYNRSLKAYYDFNDDEIHNADGSVAKFEMQYENNLSVDDSYLALLSKITNKNNRLAILAYAKVENNKMSATDLDITLIIKDVNMPDGLYEIVNKAPNITMYPIEDFPKLATFNKDEYISRGSEETRKFTAFELVTFSEVFEFYLDKLLLSVGDDDLRPIMNGISIKKTAQNEIFLVATNAHTLCKINFTQYCEFEKDDRELEYVFPVKYLKDFMKLVDGSLHIKCNVDYIFIEAQNLQYNAKLIDGKYPNYDAVIPKDNTKKIVFDHVAMNNCMKSPEVASQVAKYKGDNSIKFDFVNDGNVLFLKIRKDVGYNRDMEFIDKIKLCDIDFNYEQVSTYINLDQSIFLLMPVKDDFTENQYFAFRKNFFDVMLKTITDTEIECFFSEPNRGCVFTIEAIDYKKTLPEEKTKQQPKKLAKSKKEAVNVEKIQLNEAIETLLFLAESEENDEQRKEIYEALEILNMLKDNSYEDGGQLGKKLVFEPIKTPLN